MKKYVKTLFFATLALTISCVEKGHGGNNPPEPLIPEISIELGEITESSISFNLTAKHAISKEYAVTTSDQDPIKYITIEAENTESIIVDKLHYNTSYTIYARSINSDGQSSTLAKETIFTKNIQLSDKKYKKKLLIMKFTGTWCPYCPNMTELLDIALKEYPTDIELIAIHVNDDLEIDAQADLDKGFNVSAYPHGVVDYREQFKHTEQQKLGRAIETSLDDYTASVGIGIESKLTSGEIKIDINLEFNEEGDYKIVCALLENGIKRSGVGSVTGVYDDVLRNMTTDPFGDSIFASTNILSYSVVPEQDWNLDSMRVLVYVLKDYGADYYVNNCISATLGSTIGITYE